MITKLTPTYATRKSITSKPARLVYIDYATHTNWFIVSIALLVILALLSGMAYMVYMTL